MLQARPSPGATKAARARNTQRAYLGHWTRFHSWAQEQGLDLPEGLEAALCDYLVRLAEDGKRMATIRQARAAIIRGAELAGWPKPGVCSRQRGRLGFRAGGTSPGTPGGLGWPRTCRLRGSPSPS